MPENSVNRLWNDYEAEYRLKSKVHYDYCTHTATFYQLGSHYC